MSQDAVIVVTPMHGMKLASARTTQDMLISSLIIPFQTSLKTSGKTF